MPEPTMLQDLIQLHRAGRFEEAERGYRQWLAEHPDDLRALRLLGRLCAQRGDPADGIRLVERAVELAPDDAAGQCALADAYLAAGRLDDAVRAFERGRVLNPNLAAVHAGLGRVELLRGDLAAAETRFKVALRADPNDVQALTGLGTIANARGDSAGASQWLTKAARLAPDDPAVLDGYALAMLEAGMVDFAAEALDKALAVRPDDPLAQALRAEVHARRGEWAAATTMFESLLARGEQAGIAHVGLGDIAGAQRRYDEAVDHYDQALRAQPGLNEAALRRAQALVEGGHAERAIDGLREYAGQHPDSVRAQLGLARLLVQLDRQDAAADAWGIAAMRWPDDVSIRAGYAVVLDRAGRTGEALAEAERAAASPEPAVALLRARAALSAGDPGGAVQRLQHIAPKQLEGKPRVAMRRLRLLGLAQDAQEQWPDAAAAFLAAHRILPSRLPPLSALEPGAPETLQRLARGEALVDARNPAPVLLCGVPGSGVEQVAALLADQPGWFVRRDRFGEGTDFIGVPFEPRLAQPLDQPTLELLAFRYRRTLERARIRGEAQVVDWLPALDAHVVPAIGRTLPGVKLLVVQRDPRDALLNWLAFGWWEAFAMSDVVEAARWLRRARKHLDLATRLLPAYHADPDALLATGGHAARRQLGEFLGLGDLAWGPLARAARHDRGDLPLAFPPGHAEKYGEALAAPFAALEGR